MMLLSCPFGSISLSPSPFVGCLGQQFLIVDVVPISTTSVRASFFPPNGSVDYDLVYSFGADNNGTQSFPAPGTEEQTVTLNDTNPTPRPGVLVQVQVNSNLNLTYPITRAWTCNSGAHPKELTLEYLTVDRTRS